MAATLYCEIQAFNKDVPRCLRHGARARRVLISPNSEVLLASLLFFRGGLISIQLRYQPSTVWEVITEPSDHDARAPVQIGNPVPDFLAVVGRKDQTGRQNDQKKGQAAHQEATRRESHFRTSFLKVRTK
jgi:hypothetical protein